MIKAHKIKLYPTKAQEKFFRQSCGVARFAFNWALAKWNEKYHEGEKTSAYSLIKQITAIKRIEFPWMLDVGKCAPQYAIRNVENAFKNYFRKLKDGTIKKQKKSYISNRKSKGISIKDEKLKDFGKPNFKKKGVNDSFIAVESNHQFKKDNYKLWIPRLGWVKCAENLRFEGKVNNVTVKRIADMWFAVVNIDVIAPAETLAISENQVIVGVDLGVKTLATVSNGMTFENPKALKSRLDAVKYNHRRLDKKQKDSNNKQKQQMKLARLCYRISNIRNNAINEATSKIVNNASVIVLEDLNVEGMTKNRKLSLAINDVGFGEFRRQIEYKADWQGKKVVIADRFYPSSKTCSCCGWKKEDLKLSDREFVCENCGLEIDRDLNAAINLANYGSTQGNCGSNACGVGSSAPATVFSPTAKQEVKLINNNIKN